MSQHSYHVGVGYCTLIVITFVSIYYMVIIAWVLYYLWTSLFPSMEWGSCGNSWNSNGELNCSTTQYFTTNKLQYRLLQHGRGRQVSWWKHGKFIGRDFLPRQMPYDRINLWNEKLVWIGRKSLFECNNKLASSYQWSYYAHLISRRVFLVSQLHVLIAMIYIVLTM